MCFSSPNSCVLSSPSCINTHQERMFLAASHTTYEKLPKTSTMYDIRECEQQMLRLKCSVSTAKPGSVSRDAFTWCSELLTYDSPSLRTRFVSPRHQKMRRPWNNHCVSCGFAITFMSCSHVLKWSDSDIRYYLMITLSSTHLLWFVWSGCGASLRSPSPA